MHAERRQWLGRGLALGASWLAAGSAAAAASLRIHDDLNRELLLRLPLRRVVVFNRYTTEFIRAVGAMDTVVGIDFDPDKLRSYWPSARRAMMAGQGQGGPDFETIVGMQPDAVFFPRNSDWQRAEKLLAPFGIPVIVLTGWDLHKHESNVQLIGQLFARPERAAALNQFYRHWRAELARRLDGATRPLVYLEEVRDYRTALPGSGWHDMLETGGCRNLFADLRLADPLGTGNTPRGNIQNFEVDPETIVQRRPDALVKLQPGQYEPHPPALSLEVLRRIAQRPGFDGLAAVQAGRLLHLSYYLASGCSKITGALQLAKWLHPQRMRGIDPEAVMGQWLTDFQGVPAQRGYALSLAQLRP